MLPPAERVVLGLTWMPLRLRALEDGRRPRVVLHNPSGLHDGISPGDRVRLAPIGSDDGEPARVVDVDGGTVELDLDCDRPPDWLSAGPMRCDLVFDPTTFIRYLQVLERADARMSALRADLLPHHNRLQGVAPGGPDAWQAAFDQALNAERLALIHGPPGTGKTTLIVALLQRLVAEGDRPWALADSNLAVDHLAERAAAAGLDVVRLGRPERIHKAVRRLSLDARIDAGPMADPLRRLRKDELRLRALASTSAEWFDLRRLVAERRDLEDQARRHAIEGAQVLALTLATLARLAPELPRVHTAIVDEATQAIEPAIWAPVPFVQRLILVGDPHQLGPVVTQPGNPLARPALNRLVDEGGPAPMLEVQHRMRQGLQDLVADVYGPRYRPAPGVEARRISELGVHCPELPDAAPFVWLDTAGASLDEALDPVTSSTYNRGEIELVSMVIGVLTRGGLDPKHLAVVTPYSAQVLRLRAALGPAVEVGSVNALQGREREVVICSMVRSNDQRQLGFVADRRRLTVALTRARRLLVMIGDSATLCASPDFERLLAHAQETGGWRTVWDEPWSAALG